MKEMLRSLNFGKSVSDNGWGMFTTFLKYKLEEQGNHKTPQLWRFINHYNRAVAINTARNIVAYAQEAGAEVIVF